MEGGSKREGETSKKNVGKGGGLSMKRIRDEGDRGRK